MSSVKDFRSKLSATVLRERLLSFPIQNRSSGGLSQIGGSQQHSTHHPDTFAFHMKTRRGSARQGDAGVAAPAKELQQRLDAQRTGMLWHQGITSKLGNLLRSVMIRGCSGLRLSRSAAPELSVYAEQTGFEIGADPSTPHSGPVKKPAMQANCLTAAVDVQAHTAACVGEDRPDGPAAAEAPDTPPASDGVSPAATLMLVRRASKRGGTDAPAAPSAAGGAAEAGKSLPARPMSRLRTRQHAVGTADVAAYESNGTAPAHLCNCAAAGLQLPGPHQQGHGVYQQKGRSPHTAGTTDPAPTPEYGEPVAAVEAAGPAGDGNAVPSATMTHRSAQPRLAPGTRRQGRGNRVQEVAAAKATTLANSGSTMTAAARAEVQNGSQQDNKPSLGPPADEPPSDALAASPKGGARKRPKARRPRVTEIDTSCRRSLRTAHCPPVELQLPPTSPRRVPASPHQSAAVVPAAAPAAETQPQPKPAAVGDARSGLLSQPSAATACSTGTGTAPPRSSGSRTTSSTKAQPATGAGEAEPSAAAAAAARRRVRPTPRTVPPVMLPLAKPAAQQRRPGRPRKRPAITDGEPAAGRADTEMSAAPATPATEPAAEAPPAADCGVRTLRKRRKAVNYRDPGIDEDETSFERQRPAPASHEAAAKPRRPPKQAAPDRAPCTSDGATAGHAASLKRRAPVSAPGAATGRNAAKAQPPTEQPAPHPGSYWHNRPSATTHPLHNKVDPFDEPFPRGEMNTSSAAQSAVSGYTDNPVCDHVRFGSWGCSCNVSH